MRAVMIFLVVTVGAAWGVIRHLPATQAQAETFTVAHPREIRSVALDGRGLPLAALREVLTSRAGQSIDLAMLARDRAVLEETLVARGYLAARVEDPHVSFSMSGVFVTFAITQGPLFRIRNVAISGATARDAGVMTLGGGETADAGRIGLARQALEQRLTVRGKRALVVARLAPNASTGLVDLELSATY